MMFVKLLIAALAVSLFAATAAAQKAEVSVSVNETFFDTFFDSMYANFDAPKFSVGDETSPECDESIRIVREANRVRTGVRFHSGMIRLPLAFAGKYRLPLVGCIDYTGSADGLLNIEFDRENQRLIGRVAINSVNLTGTNGVGGTVIANLLKSTIDKKLNPLEIISLDKLSFAIPMQNAGNLKMRAVGVSTEVATISLYIRVTYEFVKG